MWPPVEINKNTEKQQIFTLDMLESENWSGLQSYKAENPHIWEAGAFGIFANQLLFSALISQIYQPVLSGSEVSIFFLCWRIYNAGDHCSPCAVTSVGQIGGAKKNRATEHGVGKGGRKIATHAPPGRACCWWRRGVSATAVSLVTEGGEIMKWKDEQREETLAL